MFELDKQSARMPIRSLTKPLAVILSSLVFFALTGCDQHLVGMLNPKGMIAYSERRLFINTLALMLIVVLPVIVMSISFVVHYRASRPIKSYKPNWDHSLFLEVIWWSIPLVIIVVLAMLTWKRTYQLDPYKKIAGYSADPLLIQAIALPWKWLFIYPQQNIATVNYLVIPAGQPVQFFTTTDNVPMSAFFIPQLGSQIYSMAGMHTQLHLISNYPGKYEGMNTLYNGAGFSDMHFAVHVVEPEKMQQWVKQTQQSSNHLTDAQYAALLKPTINDKPQFFSGVKKDLFDSVVHLYMHSVGTIHPRQLK